MYANPCGTCESDGLGFWTALIPIGTSVVGSLIGGGESDRIPSDQFFPGVLSGVQFCEGPYVVAQVADAISNIDPFRQPGSGINQDMLGVFAHDADQWERYGWPGTPSQKAGVLVALAHGATTCVVAGADLNAKALVDRILENEAERRSTLAAQVTRAREAGATVLQAELIPGVPTPLLALGALGLAGAFLFGRRRVAP